MDERPSYDEKLARILKEAAVIFAEKGYHQASIRDIAAATGVSLSGLYYYFRSKEELLTLIQEHCFGTILERLRHDLNGISDPEARLRLLIRNHLLFFVNNMREMKVLSVEADALSGEYAERVAALKREYVQLAQEMLERLRESVASERGEERGSDSAGVDLRVATFSLFGMLNWIYTWYRPGRDVPVLRLADEMTHIFLAGHLAPGVARGTASPTDFGSGGQDASIWRPL